MKLKEKTPLVLVGFLVLLAAWPVLSQDGTVGDAPILMPPTEPTSEPTSQPVGQPTDEASESAEDEGADVAPEVQQDGAAEDGSATEPGEPYDVLISPPTPDEPSSGDDPESGEPQLEAGPRDGETTPTELAPDSTPVPTEQTDRDDGADSGPVIVSPPHTDARGSDWWQPRRSPSDEEIAGNLDSYRAALASIRAGAASRSFDSRFLAAGAVVAAAPNRRVRTLFAFAREQFSFEPYVGAVRGPRGVFFSRSGNSADLSLALGALLDEVGVPWRLVNGTLSPESAGELLASVVPRAEIDAPVPIEEYEPRADLWRQRRISQHWWLEAQVRGEWLALDPSFPGLSPGQTATEATTRFGTGEIPEALRHIAVIRLRHRARRGNSTTALALETDLRELVYRNLVVSFTRPDQRHFEATLSVGNHTEVAEPVSLNDADRVWLEFEVMVGDQIRTFRRELRQGQSRDYFEDGIQAYSVLLVPGWVGPDYYAAVSSTLMSRLAESGTEVVTAILEGLHGPALERGDGPQLATLLGQAMGLIGLYYTYQSDLMSMQLAQATAVRPYFGWPRVIVTGAQLTGEGLAVQLDVEHDRLETIPFAGAPPRLSGSFQALRGRVNAELSGLLVHDVTGLETVSATRILDAAWSEGIQFISGSPTDQRSLRRLQVSNDVRDLIVDHAGEEGAVVVVPRSPSMITGAERTAWWQLDSRTGGLAGVLDDGIRDTEAGLTIVSHGADQEMLWLHEVLRVLSGLEAAMGGAQVFELDSNNMCSIACDLERIADSACGDPLNGTLDRCLVSSDLSDDPLGLGLSCGEMVDNFRCGSVIGRALVEGQVRHDSSAEAHFSGPFSAVPQYSPEGRCRCVD